jgi:hypothetical protein
MGIGRNAGGDQQRTGYYHARYADFFVTRVQKQIGSGLTKSQGKLCMKRLKGYGRRRNRPNATTIAALNTLERNAQWRQVWLKAVPQPMKAAINAGHTLIL